MLLAAVGAAAEGTYQLGPGDRVTVSLGSLKEIEIRPALIELDGTVDLEYAGRIQAAGLSTADLARKVEERLAKVIREPHVTVEVTEYGSQPVSVLGAVNRPGVHQIRGRRNLVEVLALAEGMRPEAGNFINITRPIASGPIPLPNARVDASGQFSTAEVGLKALLEARNPEANIEIRPNDVISVPRAELVYIMGSVRKPGGFVLAEKESITVLQAISMAEGILPTASTQSARILRSNGDGPPVEVAIDVKGILDNKRPDEALQPNDILFIPNSTAKTVGLRTVEAVVQMATGLVIWGRR